jgi:hypothetical protein
MWNRNLHNGKDLEEVVLREILVWVVRVQRPEVVDQNVEDAEDDHQQNRAELGLEPHDHHNACHKAYQANKDPSKAPVAAEDKADKEKDKQDASRKLEVHLAVLLVELWQAGRRKPLAHPGIRQNHQESTHDGQIAQEEVEVKDQPVSDALENNHANKTKDAIVRVFPYDDHERADAHGDYVDDQEEVREAIGNCRHLSTTAQHVLMYGGAYYVGNRAGR